MISRLKDSHLVAFLIGMLLFVFALTFIESARDTKTNRITEAALGDGFRDFYALQNKLADGSMVRMRRPLISAESLASFKTYYLLSPKRSLSDREEKVLIEWVEKGGHLVMSLKDDETRIRLWALIKKAGLDKDLGPMPRFTNGETSRARSRSATELLGTDEEYLFYSYLGFYDSACKLDRPLCYVREARVGKGEVVVFAGVPPIANGLIHQLDNPKLAARLALAGGRAAIDEFHQFMTEKTVWEMLTDPAMLFPLAGFLVMVALYFFFGAGDLIERDQRPPKRAPAAASYHRLGRELVRSALDGSREGFADAVAWHRAALARHLPGEKMEIEKLTKAGAKDDRSLALRLVGFHQKWLEKRGRKRK